MRNKQGEIRPGFVRRARWAKIRCSGVDPLQEASARPFKRFCCQTGLHCRSSLRMTALFVIAHRVAEPGMGAALRGAG
ncbi:MAG: hypothetical protein CSA70_03795 [Rhodobacterales bacterium]|nr:MAG: hypothetical protein CSA70_03795 [Rhodobacterales bacterium]